jgi:5-methyltetrahydropteroyltriglutamate--homocysteine methyltransferase
MPDRILTSHAGSLPRPPELRELHAQRSKGMLTELTDAEYQQRLQQSVIDIVARQRDVGIDLVNDGEYGHAMGTPYDYGAWWTYVFPRLGGLEIAEVGLPEVMQARQPGSSEVELARFADRRDWNLFAEAYADADGGGVFLPPIDFMVRSPVCRGPLTYTGQEAVARDIADLKAALAAAGLTDGFLNSIAPASCARIANEYYETDDEMLYACADVMREEYKAIIDAGLSVQLDDPAIAENWDQIVPEPSVEAYQRFTRVRIEALNHAIRDLPPERIRFHLCWGSWHGPHVTDIPMQDIVDLMLEINAGSYSFEAANARHEHEWSVWRDAKLPEGKQIIPGIVTHSTNVVEHPELVAERIVRFADVVGPDNVIASTDCGLGGRIHPQIAWAKLEALSEGAAIASKRLYG